MSNTSVGVVTGSDIPGPVIARLSSMPRVDLMPGEIAERDAMRRLQLGCVAAVVACAVAVGSVWYQAHSTVGSAKSNLQKTQAEQNAVSSKVNALAPVAAAFSAVEAGNKLVEQALGGEVRWSTQLRDLSMSMPANVFLSTVSIAPGPGPSSAAASTAASTPGIATLTFTGVASSRYDVAAWMNSIGALKGYSNVTYTTAAESQKDDKKVWIDFTSTATLTSDALSGRYQNLSGS